MDEGTNGLEGVRHPKFRPKQAAAGSQGSGGRLNLCYSAVEVVFRIALALGGQTDHPTEGHPV